MTALKPCIRCQITKPLEDFYVHRVRKDGRSSRCRECEKAVKSELWHGKKAADPASTVAYARASYLRHQDKHLAYKKAEYAADPDKFRAKNRALSDEAKARYREAMNLTRRNNPEKARAANRKNYVENREARLAAEKVAREANREIYAERQSRQYRKHIEKRKAASAEYYRRTYAQKKPQYNAKAKARWASKLKATPSWANKFFMEEAYALAALRTKMFGAPWEVDHIIPLRSKTVCGLHVECNLRVIPKPVNRSKGNKYDANNAIGFVGSF
jgi:hypothetical protein